MYVLNSFSLQGLGLMHSVNFRIQKFSKFSYLCIWAKKESLVPHEGFEYSLNHVYSNTARIYWKTMPKSMKWKPSYMPNVLSSTQKLLGVFPMHPGNRDHVKAESKHNTADLLKDPKTLMSTEWSQGTGWSQWGCPNYEVMDFASRAAAKEPGSRPLHGVPCKGLWYSPTHPHVD